METNESNNKMTAYYYQLQAEFYRRHEVMILERMTNGLAYAYFYLKLCVESLATNGYLRMNNLPLSVEDLSAITNVDIETVRSAVAVLLRLGMIQQVDDGAYYLEEVTRFLKKISMTPEAIRKRKQREKERLEALEGSGDNAGHICDTSVTKCHGEEDTTVTKSHKSVTESHKSVTKCHESIEIIDNNLELRDNSIDKLEEEEQSNYCCLTNAPAREEVISFLSEHCQHIIDPEGFFNYYEKTNWTIDGEPIHDWRRLAIRWEENLITEEEKIPFEEEKKLWKKYESMFGEKVDPYYYGRRYKYVQIAIATGRRLPAPAKG